MRCRLLGLVFVCVSCATSSQQAGRRPVEVASTADPTELLAEARTHFAKRPDTAEVHLAYELFLAAAAPEDSIAALTGAVTAAAWVAEHEGSASVRGPFCDGAVEAAQRCKEHHPEAAECDYALAVALGVQAREHPTRGLGALKTIIATLQHVASTAPTLDFAGAERVLAWVYLRAPGWPVGPGDPEAALQHARAATARFGDYPQNQLVLAEALLANDAVSESAQALERARKAIFDAAARGDPDAADWSAQAAVLANRIAKARR